MRRFFPDGGAVAACLLAGFTAVGIAACTADQVSTTADAIDSGCKAAMLLVPEAAVVPEAAPVVPFVLAGCGVQTGLTKLAHDPSSTAWLQKLHDDMAGAIAKAKAKKAS
jgi:hypothetical protein